ncbi:hypothetical protein KI387_031534, partial [Taxus chinensis]
ILGKLLVSVGFPIGCEGGESGKGTEQACETMATACFRVIKTMDKRTKQGFNQSGTETVTDIGQITDVGQNVAAVGQLTDVSSIGPVSVT